VHVFIQTLYLLWVEGGVRVFNAIFINILAISRRLFFHGGGNRSARRKPLTCRTSLTNLITWWCFECTSPWTVFELTNLVVIGIDCTVSCKSKYHTITTTPITTITCVRYQVNKMCSASCLWNLFTNYDIDILVVKRLHLCSITQFNTVQA
jgi:hypothetical protein